jgi:epoxyqueuosine reductase QueG
MENAKSVIILGVLVWDDLHDLVIRVRDQHEYPDEWRGRLYARRLIRYLNRKGYEAVLEAKLLSKKRMAELAGIGHYGKNSLIINPIYGPWVRYRSIVTDAPLVPNYEKCSDLCGECDECLKACPVEALTSYIVDPDKCLLGMPMEKRLSEEFHEIYTEHSPMITENSWKMCQTCQKACPVGRDLRNQRIERGSGKVNERI